MIGNLSLSRAIVEINLLQDRPWNFDALGQAAVQGALREVVAALPEDGSQTPAASDGEATKAKPGATEPMTGDGAEVVALVREYRPSMDRDVLHAWAIDAIALIQRLAGERDAFAQEADVMAESSSEQTRMLDRIAKRLGLAHDEGLDDADPFIAAINALQAAAEAQLAALTGERDEARTILRAIVPFIPDEALAKVRQHIERMTAFAPVSSTPGVGGLEEASDPSGLREDPMPTGWRLVPIVPTVEMVVAATEEWLCIAAMEDRAETIWDAMLSAAPSPSDSGTALANAGEES